MTNKQMIKNELVYLATERNVKACELNQAIKKVNNCNTYEEWLNNWLKPVIIASINCLNENGVSCWNVAPNMINDVAKIHNDLGYEYHDSFGLHSSARQANQNLAHDKKTTDATICYKKNL